MADNKQSREVTEELVGGTSIQEQYSEESRRKDVGEVSVRIDVDVTEALTGLKAVQREAREAAKALRELEAEIASSKEIDRLADFILANYPDEPGSNGTSESAVDVAIRLLEGRDSVGR